MQTVMHRVSFYGGEKHNFSCYICVVIFANIEFITALLTHVRRTHAAELQVDLHFENECGRRE